VITVLFSLAVSLTAQTGGSYQVEKSVVAPGGNRSNGGVYSLESTTGQARAGGLFNASTFSAYTGFWTPDNLAPTAAGVSVSGRVTTPEGDPLGYATVLLTRADGVSRSALTGPFGYYLLTDVEVGQVYTVTVESKRYQFAPRVLSILDELTDLNLVALP